MCGITGYINNKNTESAVANAHRLQKHRGPDSQSQWSNKNITFTHQRLSIIDLDSRSDQPMIKGNLAIVFNGEIYNYIELKQQLLKAAPDLVFNTNSDTEVLLELYRLHGVASFQKLTGMFAFAIYEIDTQRMILARDHFGIKPLFYTRIDDSFAFASELKTLVQLPGFDKTINYSSLTGALNYLWVPGNETMFNGCHKLAPAHYMIIDTASSELVSQTHCYWEWKPTVHHSDEISCITMVEQAIASSVKRHMIADVPVSSFLSGGLDSSLISVIAAEKNPKLSTYTITIAEEDKLVEQMPDDEKYARQLSQKFGFDHHEVAIKADIVKELPAMVNTLDEPIGDPAAINTFLICKAAREKGVKVLLSGMGADEIFFGYRRQKATLSTIKYKRIPAPFRKLIHWGVQLLPVKILGRGIKLVRWAQRYISFSDLPIEEAYMQSYSYYSKGELEQLFKKDISQPYKNLRQQHAYFFHKNFNNDPINQMCYTDIHMFMQGLNLSYTDRASMAASVEVRTPFIDKEMVELAMRINGNLKYKKGQSKYILKKAAEKYLPHDIIYRPKASFGAPIRSWISGELKEMVDTLLSKESVEKRQLFQYPFIKKLIDEDRKGIKDNAYRIYQLLTVELWFRQFIDEPSNT